MMDDVILSSIKETYLDTIGDIPEVKNINNTKINATLAPETISFFIYLILYSVLLTCILTTSYHQDSIKMKTP